MMKLDYKLTLIVVLATACGDVESSEDLDLARLLLLDFATAVQMVNADTTCGFESTMAAHGQVVSGQRGEDGTVTRRVERCALEIGSAAGGLQYPFFSCDAKAGRARGRIVFTGQRTITGRLTGNTQSPVIPGSSEGMTVQIESVEFEGLEVAREDKGASVTINSGSASGTARIALAASKRDGLCREPTPHSRLEDIRFADASLEFRGLLGTRSLRLNGAELTGTSGSFGDAENQLYGTMMLGTDSIQVGSRTRPVPFDKEYDRATFDNAVACASGLARVPLSRDCGNIDGFVAENSARVAFLTLTSIIGALEADKTCGFGRPGATVQTSGSFGRDGAMTTRADNCTIQISKPVALPADCLGRTTEIAGRVTVSARKVMQGTLTGDPAFPVLPTSDSPLLIEIESASLEDFTMVQPERTVRLRSGSLRGKMKPRVAKGTNGTCSIGTKIARFEGVSLTQAELEVATPSGVVTGRVANSDLQGVNGPWNDSENSLFGSVTINDREFRLPTTRESGLFDNAYVRDTFDASWQCEPGLQKPVAYDCENRYLPVPETMAQLSIGLIGAIAGRIETDSRCGFASANVINAAQSQGAIGDDTNTTFRVSGCTLEFPTRTVLSQDCNGKKLQIQGSVRISGTKEMSGYRTGSLVQPIVPTRRDGVVFDLTLDMTNAIYSQDAPLGNNVLEIPAGTLKGRVEGRFALDATTQTCSLPTPISSFAGVGVAANTMMTLRLPGLNFTTDVEAMDLSALNGPKDGQENWLRGGLTVGGQRTEFPASARLDPYYSTAAFEQSYQACVQNLVTPMDDEACSYRAELALQTARYMPMLVQAAASIVNDSGDENCSLDVETHRLDPNNVQQLAGDDAVVTWRVPRQQNGTCRIEQNLNETVSQDCLNRALHVGGRTQVQAQLAVTGRLQDQNGVEYANPSRPDAPTNYTLNLTSLNAFEAALVDPGNIPVQSLRIDSGALEVLFHPIMGRSTDDQFTYLIQTPVNRFERIRFPGSSRVSIGIRDMRFNLLLSDATVAAFAGAHNGEANSVQGTLTVDGRPFTVANTLDPDYNQTTFNQRYETCTESLQAPVPLQFP